MKAQPLDVKGEQPVKLKLDIVALLSEICGVEPPKDTTPEQLLAWWTKISEASSDEEIIRQYDLGFWQGKGDSEFSIAARQAFLNRYNQLTGGNQNANH